MSKQESEQGQIEKPNISTNSLLIPSRRTISRRNFILGAGALFAGAVVFGERAAARRQSEVLPQESQLIMEFDLMGDHYMWTITNASWGIYPPNDPDRRIGTIRVIKNNDLSNITPFQPLANEILYSEILLGSGVAVVVGGQAVDTRLDRYYLSTATTRNDGHYDPHFEIGTGILTPDQYTDRHVFKKGLPTGGVIGLDGSSLVTLGADVNGNYLNIAYSDCINPVENGTYQIRLDNQGSVIGDTFIKLSEVPTPTATVIPTSTKTPTAAVTLGPSPTAVPTAPTREPSKIYVPAVVVNK